MTRFQAGEEDTAGEEKKRESEFQEETSTRPVTHVSEIAATVKRNLRKTRLYAP